MNNCIIFICEGEITRLPAREYHSPFVSSQFCIVEKYKTLYEKALPRLMELKSPPYALPAKGKCMRIYNGLDREPLEYTPNNFHEFSLKAAIEHFSSIAAPNTELIFIRVVGCEDRIPADFTLLGYDAAWVFGHGAGDGFSAICDCMFLSRWHGCDAGGTEFLPEFNKLNDNGLFNSAVEAEEYLMHYVSQSWSEDGEYCIYEIYAPR